MIDRVRAQTQGDQLRPRYHPVLSFRESGDPLVLARLSFAAYYAVKLNVVGHGRSMARPTPRGCYERYGFDPFRSQMSFRPVRVRRSSTSSTCSQEGTIAAA